MWLRANLIYCRETTVNPFPAHIATLVRTGLNVDVAVVCQEGLILMLPCHRLERGWRAGKGPGRYWTPREFT